MAQIEFDSAQKTIFEFLKELLQQKEQRNYFSFLKKKLPKNGIYLWGPVGRGKTLIMKECFKVVKGEKKLIHFQEFIEKLHKDIHNTLSIPKKKILSIIAKEYSAQTKYLFIDEFEIKDIADAMMVVPLIHEMINQKIFIFLTSNTQPANLYLNGLQRESFLPYIEIIKNEFEIVELDGLNDYRLTKFSPDSKRILYPNNALNNNIIDKIIDSIDKKLLTSRTLKVFGREIIFNNATNDILITNYSELFLREFSYIDYITICKNFSTIIVKDVKIFAPNNNDNIVRFINFIDNAYFFKVTLYMILETSLDKMYKGDTRSKEFERTKSRLFEMNSSLYK